MATATFITAGYGANRSFPVPKRAGELRAWWTAIRKTHSGWMPSWELKGEVLKEEITIDEIFMQGRGPNGETWMLLVNRKGR